MTGMASLEEALSGPSIAASDHAVAEVERRHRCIPEPAGAAR